MINNLLKNIINHKFFNTFSTIVLLLLYFSFLYRHIIAIEAGSISSVALIFMAMETTVIALLLLRRDPVDRSTDTKSWAFALGGTFLPLLLIPSGVPLNLQLGNFLMALGGLLAIGSYLSLNTSFGVSPALRKVKTAGMYMFIRHPMYASYFILFTGYMCLSFSWLNLSIFIGMIICLIARIFFEEKILRKSADYLEYCTKVKYRIIPFIF